MAGWVKEYFELDKEIKDCNPALNALKKRRTALSKDILEWMGANGKKKATSIKYGTIYKRTQSRKAPINAGYVQERLAAAVRDEDKAAEMTRAIFDDREAKELSVLKLEYNKEGD